jgi:hypothetical protein
MNLKECTMEIESYELYHIGTKLNPYLNFDALKEKLIKELEARGYELSKEVITEPIKREVLATKNNTKIELSPAVQALNVIGMSPKMCLEVFKELMTILPSLGYELDAAVSFHEIITEINVNSEEQPLEILKKSTRIKFKLLKHIGNLGLTAIRISNVGKEEDIINLIIEPNPVSPTRRFKISLLFRSRVRDKIESFHNQLEKNLLDIMNQLGGRK